MQQSLSAYLKKATGAWKFDTLKKKAVHSTNVSENHFSSEMPSKFGASKILLYCEQ